ncbi:ABC transporter F family member 3 [Auxenochlorella protothecoides]|uniref:ABC transporter F family member 3 n=1 Tax=Auxenochlorella protothecoides TaxID=3075 RepID=A0A087S9L5_AUXPR|nr:ABC transporter F family member 3 [Auxenochlorella protothecoides]KFM22419.1 ABC transporter F family member 3 [Auxenochlorella protothecoides]
MSEVRALLERLSVDGGDETVLEYVASVVEDPDFEFGHDCEEAMDAIAPVLVDSGCLPDDAAVLQLCRSLRSLLGREEANGTSNGAAGPGPHTRSDFHALERGPVLMGELGDAAPHPSDLLSGRALIQGRYQEGEEEEFTVMRPKDVLKLRKQNERAEKVQRAAFAVHQAQALAAMKGKRVTVLRNAGGTAVRDIHLERFSVSNGGADLIDDATITLAHAHKYGLVGRNGTGKTTFLRALAEGEIKGVPANCQVLHVEQEVMGDEVSALDAVLSTDLERAELLAEEQVLLQALEEEGRVAELAGRLEAVSKRLLEIDAYGAESRAASILSGLSFTKEMMDRPTQEFSGGWRMRVALARALFVEPDLLLLDEPTNHLDLHAVLWLQDYLIRQAHLGGGGVGGWGKTVIIVSHAREFLNAVCTDIVHLHARTLTQYKGDYDIFARTFKDRVKTSQAAAAAQEEKRAHMLEFINKFRYNANRAALVQSRIKALERMTEVEVIEEDPSYVFNFPTPTDLVSPPVLGFTDVDFAYPGGPRLFRDINFGIGLESRFAIVGPNGIGKSTMLGLISGTLEPTKGFIHRNSKLRLGIFSQHHVDGLDLALTPLQYLAKCYPGHKEQEYRSHLASFGMTAELAKQTMYTLSGGQKSRVSFAKLTWTKPHMLLLDEPSNHLDLDAVEALVQGLAAFKGAVLMVSHDQHLIESTVDELWAVEDNTINVFHGTFEDYKKRLKS